MRGPAAFTRSREPQSSSNTSELVFELREEVKILKKKITKMRGNEKTLTQCIFWHMGLEDKYLTEREKLRGILERATQELKHLNDQSSQQKTVKQREEYMKEADCLRAELQQVKDTCSSLHYQLTVANEKLKKADLTKIEFMQINEARNKMVDDLQSRVTHLKCQLVEGEKLRKTLHNTILELKGNI